MTESTRTYYYVFDEAMQEKIIDMVFIKGEWDTEQEATEFAGRMKQKYPDHSFTVRRVHTVVSDCATI